jgi:hypothetical protein
MTNMARGAGFHRALGLATDEVDLDDVVQRLLVDDTTILYRTDSKHIMVRGGGDDLSVEQQSDLVHELTHEVGPLPLACTCPRSGRASRSVSSSAV